MHSRIKTLFLSLILLIGFQVIPGISAQKVPISLICWSGSFASSLPTKSISVGKLYKALKNVPQLYLDKVYLEMPSPSGGGQLKMLSYINNLLKKNPKTKFSLIGDAYAFDSSHPIKTKGGIKLSKIQKLLDARSHYPTTKKEIESFLNSNAPQIIIDINHLTALNKSKNNIINSILFDVEAKTFSNNQSQITGLYYLLYYTRKYMDNMGLKCINMETTLAYNQVGYFSTSSSLIHSLFGKNLPTLPNSYHTIISYLLAKNKITTNIFAMLYRPYKQLSDNNNIIKTTWWNYYVQSAVNSLPASSGMTITPAIGLNDGDLVIPLTGIQLQTFIKKYSNSISNIKTIPHISSSKLGIHGLTGFYNTLKKI
ncbi:MAG: hypothetical protein GY756_00580 [bacterium]|nr:hypothetical protein [bacterium]